MRRRTGLERHVRGGHVERLEHELRHVLSVGFGVHRSLREHDGMFFRHKPELVGEGAVPDVLHVIPRRDEIVRDGILPCQDAALDLRLVTDTKGNSARGAEGNVRGVRRNVAQVHHESQCASRSIRRNQPGSRRTSRAR